MLHLKAGPYSCLNGAINVLLEFSYYHLLMKSLLKHTTDYIQWCSLLCVIQVQIMTVKIPYILDLLCTSVTTIMFNLGDPKKSDLWQDFVGSLRYQLYQYGRYMSNSIDATLYCT